MFEFEKKKLENYLGKYLYNMLKQHKAFIAGGTITSLFTNRDINDIDIYFRNRTDAHNFVEAVIEDRDWIVSFTNKAILFVKNDVQCQVIYFDTFKSAQDIFNTFDFTVCMGAFDFEVEQFILHDEFMKHNSQRLLKFNQKTAFPIISALRVKKYEDKGYNISKPEYLRVILTCMNLNIDNYEDLKEQMGGMYGINYDKILDNNKEDDFNLESIIEKMIDLNLSDDYFKIPSSKIPDIEDILVAISNEKIKVVKFQDRYYKFRQYSFDKIYRDDYFDEVVVIDSEITENNLYQAVDLSTILYPGIKLYKFVKKKDNKYYSFFDTDFEYKLNETVVAKKGKYGNDHGIYCGFMQCLNDFTYKNDKNGVLIELELEDIEDVLKLSNLRVKKAKFIREVPKEEWEVFYK